MELERIRPHKDRQTYPTNTQGTIENTLLGELTAPLEDRCAITHEELAKKILERKQ